MSSYLSGGLSLENTPALQSRVWIMGFLAFCFCSFFHFLHACHLPSLVCFMASHGQLACRPDLFMGSLKFRRNPFLSPFCLMVRPQWESLSQTLHT